jgi:hypothetical protein
MQLEKARNDNQRQTNPLATTCRGILGSIPTAVLTFGSITNLEDTTWNKWAVFGVITGVFWFVVFGMVTLYRILIARRKYRIWRLVRMLGALGLLAFLICAIIFVPSVGGGIGLKNIILIIFANFSVGRALLVWLMVLILLTILLFLQGAAVVTQSLLYIAPRSLTLRTVVDGAYRVLDYILGYFLFFFLFLLSFLQVFDWVQTTLLYNIKFQKKLEQARLLGDNNFISSYVKRSLERNNNKMRDEFKEKYMRRQSSQSSLG